MGALTLKNFPFELRGWEIQKFKSFDPTDGFISLTTLYLNKNKIVQVEPSFNTSWLSDKGRHYFDAVFEFKNSVRFYNAWPKLYYEIATKIYIFEHCCKQTSKNYLITIVFDFLSIELLGMLNLISKNYSLIALKQVQPWSGTTNDFESDFQLNNLTRNKTLLINSTLCLLITTNPRYEGYLLNLNLRQRVLKKKFKCVLIGSLINLTFSVSFIGSNINVFKIITEGNHFICQNFKHAKNPFIVCNNELFKRKDSKAIKIIIKTFFYFNNLHKIWFGLNVLSSSLSEIATLVLNPNKTLQSKDLHYFSCIYFLNISVNKITYLKRITELQLLQKQTFIGVRNNLIEKKLVVDQNYSVDNNVVLSNKMLLNYKYIPASSFYQNDGTFINTEGFIKRTTPVISKNKIKNDWQILRKFLKHLKKKLVFFNKKDNKILCFNSNRLYDFKSFINFQYYPVKKLTDLSCYLNIKNKVFIINKARFKQKSTKFITTKIKYLLDDFFNSNKDKYSRNSAVLISCSRQFKFQATNFFRFYYGFI